MGIVTEIKKLNRMSLGLLVLLLQLFLFINISAFFPASMVSEMTILISTYLIVYGVLMAVPDQRDKLLNAPLSQAKYYVVTFLIAAAAFGILANFFLGSRTPDPGYGVVTAISTVALSMILVHTVIVAYVEEFFFRDFLYKQLGESAFWSSLLFGLFHFAVYDFNVIAMIVASLLGYFFLVIKRRFTPNSNIANVAVHAAYNVVIIGVVNYILGGQVNPASIVQLYPSLGGMI